jgi:tagaturonate epimerase
MAKPLEIGKYSIGIGDRFGRQGKAQLMALVMAKIQGISITPVWNKSFREHQIIGTQPGQVREEAEQAVRDSGWSGAYFIDADHISMKTVDNFIDSSNFFTLDVADFIGQSASDEQVQAFVKRHSRYIGETKISDLGKPLHITQDQLTAIAGQYLYAVEQAERIYCHIAERKSEDTFVIEISMDETAAPQKPVELFFILRAIADHNIPVRTIAPKFSGRFNKGVDYVGDVQQFAGEFEDDLAILAYAIKEFSLPESLKLSVHSGSDKFAIYGVIQKALKKFNAGLHLKTAGTTWLEELIGLAEAGGSGLDIAKLIYKNAYGRMDELCQPYATVIDIRRELLPDPGDVENWDSAGFTAALRHDMTNPLYNPNFRQLLHVGYKIAAELGANFLSAVDEHENVIARNVTENLYQRHVKKLFL